MRSECSRQHKRQTSNSSARLAAVLGTEISLESLNDAEVLRAELIQPAASRYVAERWLGQVTDGGIMRIDAEARGRLVDEIAESFRAQQRLDVVLANWISGDSQHTADWYSAMSAAGPDTMVHRLASLSMNVDLRCTRCHDAKIEGSGRQEDYWSFAAFFRREVHRARDGKWTVGTDQSAKPCSTNFPMVVSGWCRRLCQVLGCPLLAIDRSKTFSSGLDKS